MKLKSILNEIYNKEIVVIKGNPKYIKNNKNAESFYNQIKKYLIDLGYTASFDAGKPHTSPKEDVYAWVGHSRGVDRLRFAPDGVKTLSLDDYEENPNDDLTPGPNHYIFNDDMKTALKNL
jgi:hypothetical protein